jgi:hypothetical protein
MSRSFTITVLIATLLLPAPARAGLWQYSATIDSIVNGEIQDHPRAYLWIPSKCTHIRAVVVAQHNLLEESILLNPRFRSELGKLDMAEVWIMPNIDFTFDFHKGAGEAFNDMMKRLAQVSGYNELDAVPIGHSAAASYPWNFAAWAPGRTLAILSVHGDMPLTNLTGNGKPHPDWRDATIDGLPGLFVMGQYEWWDKRLQPGLDYVAKHPATPLAALPDIGHGHFDTSDAQADFLAMFIRKAVQYRLGKDGALKPVDPRQGWLVDRWDPETGRKFDAAPYAEYKGDRANAFWCFDREMARATQAYGAGRTLNPNRSIVYVQDGLALGETPGPAGKAPHPKLEFDADGRTLHFDAFVVDGTIPAGAAWNDAQAKAVHARPLETRVLCGPIVPAGNGTWRLEFDQSGFNSAYRSYNAFLTSMIPDLEKEMVRSSPTGIFLARNKSGAENAITFPAIRDVADRKPIILGATTSSGLPVAYYVDSGPAQIDGDTLRFTPIPPRSKFPVQVRVIAWQWGRAQAPQVKSADPVIVTFDILK